MPTNEIGVAQIALQLAYVFTFRAHTQNGSMDKFFLFFNTFGDPLNGPRQVGLAGR